MFRNLAGQKLTVFVFDFSTGAPKTGDAANLTCYVSKDDGAVTVLTDTSATELDATNAKGSYSFDLTQGETDANKLVFTGKSSTANVAVVAQTIYTLPTTGILAPATAGRTLQVESDGMAHADLKEWLGVAPLALASQRVVAQAADITNAAISLFFTSNLGSTGGDVTANSLVSIICGAAIVHQTGFTGADASTQSAATAAGFRTWQELKADHLIADSFGDYLDDEITSRMATFTLPTNFSALLINASGHISRVTLTDTLTTYTGNTPQTGDSFARLGAPAGASIAADIASVPSAVWAFVVESTITAVQILRGLASMMMGKASGGGSAPVFRDLADTKNRISMTVDASGNRTAVVRDLT